MSGLTLETKDEMLAIFARPGFTVGLFEDGDELIDPRYERLPVEFGAPQDDRAATAGRRGGGDSDGLRFIENLNELRFDDMGRDHRVDSWGVFDADGNLKAVYPLIKARDLPAEDQAVFRPGSLRIGIP